MEELCSLYNAEKVVAGVSRRQNSENPLAPQEKMEILQNWFPRIEFSLDPKIPSDPISLLLNLSKGFDRVIVSVGLERLEQYVRWISGEMKSGRYGVDRMVFVVEHRSQQAPSGTRLRKLALEGRLEEFTTLLPAQGKKDAEEIYGRVRLALSS